MRGIILIIYYPAIAISERRIKNANTEPEDPQHPLNVQKNP